MPKQREEYVTEIKPGGTDVEHRSRTIQFPLDAYAVDQLVVTRWSVSSLLNNLQPKYRSRPYRVRLTTDALEDSTSVEVSQLMDEYNEDTDEWDRHRWTSWLQMAKSVHGHFSGFANPLYKAQREANDKYVVETFTRWAGMTPYAAMEACSRKTSRCKCGSRRLRESAGFPGETLLICDKCGNILDSHLDLSAIE